MEQDHKHMYVCNKPRMQKMHSIELLINFDTQKMNEKPVRNDLGLSCERKDTFEQYMPMKPVEGTQPFTVDKYDIIEQSNKYDDLSSFLDFENAGDSLTGCAARRHKEKFVLKPNMLRKQSSAPAPAFDDQISFKSNAVHS